MATPAWSADAKAGDAPQPTAEQLHFFEAEIRPLLIEHCYECHSAEHDVAEGELVLDSRAGLRKGGSLGPALVPGEPEKSLLMKAVVYRDSDLQMPPGGKLAEDEIAAIGRWIKMGAPDPRGADSQPAMESAADEEDASPLSRDPQSHWAFQAPETPAPPTVQHSGSHDRIDDYAAAASQAKQLPINPIASRQTLIRRLYFDLTGLPPTPEQIERFVQNDRPDAYRRLVDELLASPAYGERFGRHWLDVARYADTVGYALAGRERRYKGSHRYRDWVIQAFASDMPYDEMLRHQIAGDRTDPENKQGNLDAMGFLTLGRKFLNPLDVIDDRIDVVTRGVLGLTVTCARCHDHKFDPIPTADYYSLSGLFVSSHQPDDTASPLALVDKPNPSDVPILLRGQRGNRGPIAPRQYLTALRNEEDKRFTDGSGRRELVDHLVAEDNPLTARVMVNRIWQHLVGKPLVETPSDFGFRTEPPAVAEVLDELAVEFADHWSIKQVVRRIVLSRIYRQSSDASEEALTIDPDNKLLARSNRQRRDFESLRDSALAVADSLDRDLGGEPVQITFDTVTPRRTIYAYIDRQNLPSLFRTFDFASPDAHAPERYFTTVPQQALYLLNDPQMIELAGRTAKQIRRSSEGDSPAALARNAFRRILSREPTDQELADAVEFLQLPVSPLESGIDPRTLWSYGTATIDAENRPKEFEPFAVFANSQWQAAEKFPTDAPYGYAFLSNENGHTPRQSDLAVVRRFTAPFTGTVRLQGQMGHRADQGDGVQATIWIGDRRVFDQRQKKSNRPYGPLRGRIKKGQTIVLVASPGESDSFDSFFWRVGIRLTSDDGQVLETESTRHFTGPYQQSTDPLDRLEQLAQTLLLSNEFAFVD